jgi:tetratricopeptide (TPR) repeat protein
MLALVIFLLAASSAPDTATLWEQAKAALERRQYAEARRVLTLAVKAAPADAALWYHLGVSCAELKDADAAIGAFEKARALAPGRAEVYFSLGLEYWHKGEVGKAKSTYQRGLALNPAEPAALQNYALLLMKTGDYRTAVEPLLALKQVPELTLPARVSLIECYLKTRDRPDADQETDELLRLGVAGPEEETKLAAILVQDGDQAAAEKVLRASLSRQPEQANAYAALGAILLDRKQYPEAAECLGRAVALAPDSSEYALAFAEALLVWNRTDELLKFLRSVQSRFGNLPEFQYKRALAYYGVTNFSDAIATLEKLLQMNPRRQDQIYFMLGNSYLVTGQLSKAEDAYRKAIEMNPKDPAYYQEFATLLRREGPEHLDEAVTELKRALQFDPSDASLLLQLALCYEAKKDLNSAVGPAEEATRLKPEVLPAHVALARIYFRLGKRAEGQREKKTIAELEEKQQQSLAPKGSPAEGRDGPSH